jgi:hypothetical protein
MLRLLGTFLNNSLMCAHRGRATIHCTLIVLQPSAGDGHVSETSRIVCLSQSVCGISILYLFFCSLVIFIWMQQHTVTYIFHMLNKSHSLGYRVLDALLDVRAIIHAVLYCLYIY